MNRHRYVLGHCRCGGWKVGKPPPGWNRDDWNAQRFAEHYAATRMGEILRNMRNYEGTRRIMPDLDTRAEEHLWTVGFWNGMGIAMTALEQSAVNQQMRSEDSWKGL